MTVDAFIATLDAPAPPPDLSPPLLALWHDGHGNWHAAHAVAQDIDDDTGAWIHAYLHRKEGDLGNAGYWYRRAGRRADAGPLDAEWRQIVAALLETG